VVQSPTTCSWIPKEDKNMKGLGGWTITMMTVVALCMTACGGAQVKSEQSSYSTTLGQELKDLEDAYKRGIITEKQYEEAKEKLIQQRTK
jgi:hypothetical protein